jgi:7,8-dihydropterin-6-yl-methyl-4-(beta-D-ribofuranosyl)aminobenzene 5'-phosphate synthase
MPSINRRDAIKKGGRLLMGLGLGTCIPAMLCGCSDQEVSQKSIANLMKGSQIADAGKLKLTVLYDNVSHAEGLHADWGFACLVEGLDKTILFDTGRYANILMSNMETLGIDPRSVDEVVLSHDHPDHIGGTIKLIESRPEVKITLVKSFGSGFKNALKKYGARICEVDSPHRVTNSVLTTGEMKDFVRNEHSLIILTSMGSVVLTGCAHPGVVDIVQRAKLISRQEVLLVAGGFHLLRDYGSSLRHIVQQLKDLGVRHVAPSHCTGSEAGALFAAVFGKGFIDSGVGRIIRAADLHNAG